MRKTRSETCVETTGMTAFGCVSATGATDKTRNTRRCDMNSSNKQWTADAAAFAALGASITGTAMTDSGCDDDCNGGGDGGDCSCSS